MPDDITQSKPLNQTDIIKKSILKYFLIPFAFISTDIVSSIKSVSSLIDLERPSRAKVILEEGYFSLYARKVGKNNISSPIPP